MNDTDRLHVIVLRYYVKNAQKFFDTTNIWLLMTTAGEVKTRIMYSA